MRKLVRHILYRKARARHRPRRNLWPRPAHRAAAVPFRAARSGDTASAQTRDKSAAFDLSPPPVHDDRCSRLGSANRSQPVQRRCRDPGRSKIAAGTPADPDRILSQYGEWGRVQGFKRIRAQLSARRRRRDLCGSQRITDPPCSTTACSDPGLASKFRRK